MDAKHTGLRSMNGNSEEDSARSGSVYGEYYFQSYHERPYVRDEVWFNFFGHIADRIVSDIQPSSVLDAGCATGFLVEALRQRGVEAFGVDISEYAIRNVHPSIQPYCWTDSVTSPFPRRYDLITCIEVLEHLPDQEAEQAVINFTRHADDVLFSSTPSGYGDPTHCNVRPPEYWAELFARQGFYRDVEFSCTFISTWAVRYRKATYPTMRVIASYERRLWQLFQEVQGSREALNEQSVKLEQKEQASKALNRELAEYKEREAAAREAAARALAEQHQLLNVRIGAGERLARSLTIRLAEAEQALVDQSASVEERERAFAEQLAERERALSALTGSAAWIVAKRFHGVRSILAPDHSRRHRAMRRSINGLRLWKREGTRAFIRKARRLASRHRPDPDPPALVRVDAPAVVNPPEDYPDWIVRNEPTRDELTRQRAEAAAFPYWPLISVITPVYNTPARILDATIESLRRQTYDNWELCLADGNSEDPETRQALAAWAGRDARIRITHLDRNLGISGNSNAALAAAQGEYIALLDHDDELTPFALFEVVKRLNQDPGLDFLYSDRDLISEDGARRFCPLFKPDWSPDILLTANYLVHLNVIRTRLAREIGGFRPETDGAQDWDFFLRIVEATDKIAHIPKVLYHWRVWSNSCSSSIQAKPYALEAQRRTVEDHLRRTGQAGEAILGPWGVQKIRSAAVRQKVSIIIPSKGPEGLLPLAIHSLLDLTHYDYFEIIIIRHGPRTQAAEPRYEASFRDPKVQVVYFDQAFNLAAVNNFGARHAGGQALLFLSGDVEPIDPTWLEELVDCAERPRVGVAGAKLIRPDGTLHHAGTILGLGGLTGGLFAGVPDGANTIFGSTDWYRNLLAVSWDCMMVRRDLFEELGGLDEEYSLYGSDVDFCLKARDRGFRIVYTPFARLRYHGSGPDHASIPRDDLARLHARCFPFLMAGDPFYNPNLSLRSPNPALRPSSEQPPIAFSV